MDVGPYAYAYILQALSYYSYNHHHDTSSASTDEETAVRTADTQHVAAPVDNDISTVTTPTANRFSAIDNVDACNINL